MRFTTDDKQLITWTWVKNCVENQLLKVFWQKMEVRWWVKDTDQIISVRYLTLLIFAVG